MCLNDKLFSNIFKIKYIIVDTLWQAYLKILKKIKITWDSMTFKSTHDKLNF